MNPQTANTTDSDTEQSEGTEGMFSNPFAKVSLFKEDKPNILAWISLFVGIAIGCMFMYFVVVPSAKNAIRSQFESEERDYASQLNVQGAAIQSKESEIVQLQIQVSELEDRIGDLDTGMLDPFVYDPLFDAANMVIVLLKKGDETTSDEILATADAVFAMNLSNTSATESVEMSETAATLYATLCESSYPRAIEIASEKADQAYAADDYANATIYYQQVYNFDPDNAKAVYSLGLCYEAEGQFEQASMYYNIILELFPDSSYYQNAVDRLGGL
jgi:tetratricopeptide (TPR) repeat protein